MLATCSSTALRSQLLSLIGTLFYSRSSVRYENGDSPSHGSTRTRTSKGLQFILLILRTGLQSFMTLFTASFYDHADVRPSSRCWGDETRWRQLHPTAARRRPRLRS